MKARGIVRLALVLLLCVPIPVLIATGHMTTILNPGSRHSDKPDEPETHQDDGKLVVCSAYVDLEYGVTGLYPTQPGRVAEIRARENDTVKAGDVLLRLDDRAARFRVDEAQAALNSAKAHLERAEMGPDQHRLKIAQQQASIDAARHRLATARHSLLAKEKIQQIESVGRKKEDPVMKEEVAAAGEKTKELEAAERAEQEMLADLKVQDPAVELRRAQAEVATMQARLDQARLILEEHTLRAPANGTVLRVLVGPDELLGVPAKKAAVQFCPEGPRIVRADVEQAFASRVSIGQAATIEDDVHSGGGAWNGRVVRISDWYVQRRLVSDEVLQMKDVRTLECVIALSEQPTLRIGQRIRVTLRRVSP